MTTEDWPGDTAPLPHQAPVDRVAAKLAGMAIVMEDSLEEGGLDGLHHLWCKRCHPDWDASPVGPGVGTPFTAWCGLRAVILARWLSDELPPGACQRCSDPATPCASCGWLP